jgi:hypothetical protein
MTRGRPKWRVLTAVLALALAGCGKSPGPVLDARISQGDWSDYHHSLEVIDARQRPAERTEFAEALQELKFQAMAGGGKSNADLSSDLRAQVAGWTVRDVLVLGLTIKADRKQEEEKALRRSMRRNQRLRTKPGDTDSAGFLASVHTTQAQQLATLQAEIGRIEARLKELDPGWQKPHPAAAEDLEERPAPKT